MGKKVLLTALFTAGAFVAAQAGQLNAGNTTVAEEWIAAGNNTTSNLANAYQVDGPVADTTNIILTLNAGSFAAGSGNTVYMCDGSTSVGSGTISAGAQTVTIDLTSPLATGRVYTFHSAATCNAYIQYGLTGLTAGQTVTLTVSAQPNTPAVNASAVVATVRRQFSAEIRPVESRINLTTLRNLVNSGSSVPFTSGDSSIAAFRIVSDNTIISRLSVAIGSACLGTLSANFSTNFTVRGTLTEFSTITLTNLNGASLGATYAITAADRTAGQATLTVNPSAVGFICEGAPANLYNGIALKVDGANNINPQDIRTSIRMGIGTRTFDLLTDEVSHRFRLDATRAYIPLVGRGTGRETYIKIQSDFQNISQAPIVATVVLSNGTTFNVNLGTMTAGQVRTITATEIVNAVTSAGRQIDPYNFAIILNVPAPEERVYIYANIIDPNGAKRVPVKIRNGTIVE